MPNKWIPWVKVAVHVLCLLPVLGAAGDVPVGARLALQADPVNYITHVTGFWTLWHVGGARWQ